MIFSALVSGIGLNLDHLHKMASDPFNYYIYINCSENTKASDRYIYGSWKDWCDRTQDHDDGDLVHEEKVYSNN